MTQPRGRIAIKSGGAIQINWEHCDIQHGAVLGRELLFGSLQEPQPILPSKKTCSPDTDANPTGLADWSPKVFLGRILRRPLWGRAAVGIMLNGAHETLKCKLCKLPCMEFFFCTSFLFSPATLLPKLVLNGISSFQIGYLFPSHNKVNSKNY